MGREEEYLGCRKGERNGIKGGRKRKEVGADGERIKGVYRHDQKKGN